METPIICTDVAAQSELVPKEWLVAADGDVAARLSDAVWPLATDPERRRKMGREARCLILDRHGIEKTWEALLNLYDGLLA